MKFHLISAKLTGNPSDSGWAQVHDFEPQDPKKLDSRGHLVAVISASGPFSSSGGVVTTGREILTRFHEEYYGDLNLTPFDALKEASEKVVKEFAKTGIKVEISACSLLGEVINTVAYGGGVVSIFRDGTLTAIINTSRDQTLSASGKGKNKDLLILSTSGVLAGIGQGVLKAAFSSIDPTYATGALAPQFHASQNMGDRGLAVIKLEESEELPIVEDLPKEETSGIEERQDQEEIDKPEGSPGVIKSRGIFNRRFFPKRLYIRSQDSGVSDSRRRKTAALTGMILLALLVISIGFGIRQKWLKSVNAEYEEKLTEARHNLDEAKALFILNPERARELFAASQQIVESLSKDYPQRQEAKDLVKELSEGKSTVLGEFDITPDEFLDLGLIDGFEGGFLAGTGDAIYAFDKAKRRVVEVIIDTKKTEVVVGPSQLNNVKNLAAYSGRVFVVEDDGVFEVSETRQKVLEKKWNGDILLYAYAGNIYLLEKDTSIIWRYSATPNGFSEGRSWMAPGISIDLSNVSGWSIDGTVWILTSSGKVERYSFGSPQDLKDLKVFPDLVKPTAIYTNEQLNNVYIMDPQSERVVVIDKEGNYKAQFKSSVIKDAIGLYASEKEKKIIVLTKDKLYSLPLGN